MPKSVGKIFEENIKKSFPDYCMVYRPPDAAGSFNMTGNGLRFSQHSPADFFVFDGKLNTPKFFVFECKTVGTKSISFENSKEDQGVIHWYQRESLKKFQQYENVEAGFLLDFRESDCTYYVPIDGFENMADKLDKKSFNEYDMAKCASPQLMIKKKLKVNYRYDMETFLNTFNK